MLEDYYFESLGQDMNKVRLQFEFSEAALERLDKLVTETDAASRAEVVRRALAVYDRLKMAVSGGASLVLRQPDGSEEQLILL